MCSIPVSQYLRACQNKTLVSIGVGVAFAVPLLFYRRTHLAGAVSTSVKAVFSSFLPMLAWGVLLSVVMLAAILLFLPLFPVIFPVLAYASRQAYREVFPQ